MGEGAGYVVRMSAAVQALSLLPIYGLDLTLVCNGVSKCSSSSLSFIILEILFSPLTQENTIKIISHHSFAASRSCDLSPDG